MRLEEKVRNRDTGNELTTIQKESTGTSTGTRTPYQHFDSLQGRFNISIAIPK
jgi:hypothetical protein